MWRKTSAEDGKQNPAVDSLSQKMRREYLCYGFIRLIKKQKYIIPNEIKKLCFKYLNHLTFRVYTKYEMYIKRKYNNALQDEKIITKFQNVLQQKYGNTTHYSNTPEVMLRLIYGV